MLAALGHAWDSSCQEAEAGESEIPSQPQRRDTVIVGPTCAPHETCPKQNKAYVGMGRGIIATLRFALKQMRWTRTRFPGSGMYMLTMTADRRTGQEANP